MATIIKKPSKLAGITVYYAGGDLWTDDRSQAKSFGDTPSVWSRQIACAKCEIGDGFEGGKEVPLAHAPLLVCTFAGSSSNMLCKGVPLQGHRRALVLPRRHRGLFCNRQGAPRNTPATSGSHLMNSLILM